MEKIMPKCIISTPFTGKRTETGFSGQKWYDWRYKIFKNYTLESLKNQTDKDFFWWLQFRPEEKHNPTTIKIRKELDKSGLNYKMTFHGINFIDDMRTEINADLEERLEKMYAELPQFHKQNIYEVMLDSDDTLHKDYVEMVKKKPLRERGACHMRQGYIYSIQDDRLAHWTTPNSNQDYLIMFPNEIYYDPKKRLEYLKGLESHEQVPQLFNSEELPAGMFCNISHGFNISSVWGHQFMGQEIYDEGIKQNILNDFSIKYD